MISSTKARVFPLHLTPFEAYMFVDDFPKYPMTFVMQFEFSGQMDRDAFQRAVDAALNRHPLLRSIIRPAKANRDCWVSPENYNSQIQWGQLHEPIFVDGAGEYINLRSEIGLRVWGRNDAETAVITIAFHHTATDGIGAYQFFGDVLWFYAREMGAEVPDLCDMPATDLRRRLSANVSRELLANQPSEQSPQQPNAQPLAAKRNDKFCLDDEFLFPRFFSHRFDKKQYRELRLKAQDQGQTINDRLLQALFETLADWNENQSAAGKQEFCVNMPLDLRQPGQPDIPASNVVTCSFIRRTADQIRNRDDLSRFLREEAIKVKHSRLNSPFMRMLVHSPLDLMDAQSSYSSDDCKATAVFSNTGDPTRRFLAELPRVQGKVHAGNLVLEDITAVSPLRDKTRLAVGIFTYRRELKIVIRTDPFVFSSDDSQSLLNLYLDHFQNL